MTQYPYRAIKGKRLRLFVGEAEQWQGKALSHVIVEQARQHGIMGAVVVHGIEGFGPEHALSTERLPDIADNLPMIIEIVDTNEAIEQFLPVLDQLMPRGMITVIPVDILVRKDHKRP